MSDNGAKLTEAFAVSLGISEADVDDDLRYNAIPEWDSIAHMVLITTIEEAFDIMLDTEDIIGMSSVAKTKEILSKYGVVI